MGLNDVAHKIEAPAGAHFAVGIVAPVTLIKDMGGILGRLLHEFAVTIGAAILVSGFVALTLTPMLCSRFLRPPQTEKHGRLYQYSERVFEGMRNIYDRSLSHVLKRPRATMVVSGVLVLATAYMFAVIPKGFLPSEDTGNIFIFTEGTQGISFDSMVRHQKALAEIVSREPSVGSFMSSVGAGGPNVAGNSGRLFLRLKPRAQREKSVDELIEELRPKLSSVPGIQAFLQNLPPIRLGGMLTKSLYQLALQSPDTDELYKYAPLLEARMKASPGLQDVNSDLQIKNPQVTVDINRDKAAALGISAQQVEDALYNAYGARQISTIFAPNNQYKVIVELLPERLHEATSGGITALRRAMREFEKIRRQSPTHPNQLGPLAMVLVRLDRHERYEELLEYIRWMGEYAVGNLVKGGGLNQYYTPGLLRVIDEVGPECAPIGTNAVSLAQELTGVGNWEVLKRLRAVAG